MWFCPHKFAFFFNFSVSKFFLFIFSSHKFTFFFQFLCMEFVLFIFSSYKFVIFQFGPSKFDFFFFSILV